MALFHRARHENIASRLERKGGELSRTAAEKGTESSSRVADILRRASDDIRSTEIRDYKERIMGMMSDAREHVEGHAEDARENIRSRPLTSVMMAMGLGMLAGAAIGMIGSRMAREYTE